MASTAYGYSDLDLADIENLKFIEKSPDDAATFALLNKIVLEVNCRWHSFEVDQSVIDASATF